MNRFVLHQSLSPTATVAVMGLTAAFAADSNFSSDPASWPEIELSTYVSNNAAPTFSSFENSLTSLSQAAVLDFGQEIATVYASLLDGQEPLGTEFEAVWDANVDQLYEV